MHELDAPSPLLCIDSEADPRRSSMRDDERDKLILIHTCYQRMVRHRLGVDT
jgi:hypothetical protein